MYGAATEAGPGMAIGSARLDQADVTSKPRESHVMAEMARLLKASEYIHQLLSELEQRTSVVTRPEGPAAAGPPTKEPMSLVPLAGGLAEANARIEQAIARIRSLTQRLEL